MEWKGVMPAVTTPFGVDLSVDAPALDQHCRWLLNKGCSGVIVLGSLGEGGTLERLSLIHI